MATTKLFKTFKSQLNVLISQYATSTMSDETIPLLISVERFRTIGVDM